MDGAVAGAVSSPLAKKRLTAAHAVDSDEIPEQQHHHGVAIELRNRFSALTRERDEQVEQLISGKTLIRDWNATYHELLEHDVEGLLQQTFPIWSKAMTITTDWRFRVAAGVSFVWFIIAFFTSFYSCFSKAGPNVTLVYSTSTFVMLCTTANTLANPSLFIGAILRGRIHKGKVGKDHYSTNGYYRLMEAQLSLIKNLGEGDTLPKEGFVFKVLLQTLPVAIIVLCVALVASVNTFWSFFVASMGSLTSSADCSIPIGFQYSSGFLLAPFVNAALSLYACTVTLCGLGVGCSLCDSMTSSWVKRYVAAKYLHASSLPASVTAHDLRNDAYERYLLIHGFYDKSSLVWNNYLATYIFASTLVFVYSCAIVYSSIHSAIGLSQLMWLFTSFIAFVAPLYLVSAANASSAKIESLFRYAVPPRLVSLAESLEPQGQGTGTQGVVLRDSNQHYAGNFSVIGGRTEWSNFIKEAPLHWTVLGLPVTFDRLLTFCLGTGVALATATLPRILIK